jgi:hypothetical protein
MKTPTSTTQTKRAGKLGHIALALALSCGTVGGMMAFAAMTEPAFARGNGGGAGPAGGAAGGVMNPAGRGPVGAANDPNEHQKRGRNEICNGSRDMPQTDRCKYTQPRLVRIVNLHGFANCAVVQQLARVDGKPGEFYCARSM